MYKSIFKTSTHVHTDERLILRRTLRLEEFHAHSIPSQC